MKRKFLIALLSAVAVICLALGLSACAKTAEPKPSGIPVSTAYAMATELGYEGNSEEFVSAMSSSNEEKTIVSVYHNENGEIIVLFSDGTTLNLGTASHSHSYGSWQPTVAATCTSIGYYTRTCSVCGDIDYKFIEAKGHTPLYISHDQSLHSYECKTCGEIITEEHDFDEDEVCGFCDYKADYTLGLNYTINTDGTAYSVKKGIGYREYENVVIPSTYRGLPVTAIYSSGFSNCTNMKSIVIPDSVTEIGQLSFTACKSMKSIIIPDSVTKIGNHAFALCQSLTDITLPQNLKSIGNSVFMRCTSLENITLPENLTEIGTYIFRDCTSLKKINIPADWTSVPYGMYKGCTGIENFELPENITSIGNYAFRNCAFTSVTIPENITEIGLQAFYGCNKLETLVLPDNLTSIGDYAFAYCTALKKISLPAGETEYGTYIFKGCTALESVTLKEGFTIIKTNMFYGCENLTELIIPASLTLIEASALLGTNSLTEITYNGTTAEWKAVEKKSGWKTEDNIITGLTVNCTDDVLEYIW